MKKIICVLLLLVVLINFSWAEEAKEAKKTSVLISPDLVGLIFGYFDVVFEIPMGGIALEIQPSYFNLKSSPILGAALPEDFECWTGGAKLGVNIYFSGNAPNGFFIGAFANGGYATIGDPSLRLSGVQIGAGGKIGYRWVWDWFSLAPQFSIGYNKFMANLAGIDPLFAGSIEGLSYGASLGIALAF